MKPDFAFKSYRTAMALAAVLPASGCGLINAPVIDPKGPIALAERDLMFTAVGLMMIVIIPVFVMAFAFAWRYRSSNRKARYAPDWSYSAGVDAVIWLVPALIVLSLGILIWRNTHRLDPYARIESPVPPLEIEVVAQDWKWLFIYPTQGIAVVNQLVFPSRTPLSLRITSDTVMNSFFIPALGGQIYAMAGMQTRLHLLADAPGRFVGRNTQYSGAGFADQHFEAIAASGPEFEAWLAQVRQAPERLTAASYRALATPRRLHPVTYYSEVEPDLFNLIIRKYSGGRAGHGQPLTE